MIPYFDYLPLHRRLQPELNEALERVMASGRLILGAEVRAFEEEFSAACGVGHGIGVNSGTDALILAFKALEIGPGDAVLTVSNAGVPPVAAIRAAGAVPRFVDVLPDTLSIDPEALERARDDRCRAVLAVHLYGQPVDLGAVGSFADRHGLILIEDCAQAHGATYEGRPVGSFGRIGCFSFYPTKNLGAYGDGGICVTDDPALDRRLRRLRMYGFDGDAHAHVEGLNSRLDELQAALLRVKLRHLDAAVDERRRLAERYGRGLSGTPFGLPVEPPGTRHARHLMIVRTAERGAAIAALEAASIGHGLHYPEPVHRMEAYLSLGYPPGALPVTERACSEVLSLPIYPGLSEVAVDRVVETLRASAMGGR